MNRQLLFTGNVASLAMLYIGETDHRCLYFQIATFAEKGEELVPKLYNDVNYIEKIACVKPYICTVNCFNDEKR